MINCLKYTKNIGVILLIVVLSMCFFIFTQKSAQEFRAGSDKDISIKELRIANKV